MNKACKRCLVNKDVHDFYANDSTCKECRKRLVRNNRKANIEYYREYDRNRGNRQTPEYQAEYRKTERRKQVVKEWQGRNKEKRAAHVAVGNAVRDGKLIKQPCEVCGKDNAQAHHDDYSKQLDVMWLCTEHHAERHKYLNEMERQAKKRKRKPAEQPAEVRSMVHLS
jgi:hypothetical protein